ncbi:hypothetical protein Mterra_03497 [Calidithermus terrae]|uniref:Uncharacterized protein n=1 Tax=Calidithermus terrae TaxID=1408545 RepID=A0A399E821_9DEIN|nr:hypothetical protein Mterra_03497 [Calidithermus terrae]
MVEVADLLPLVVAAPLQQHVVEALALQGLLEEGEAGAGARQHRHLREGHPARQRPQPLGEHLGLEAAQLVHGHVALDPVQLELAHLAPHPRHAGGFLRPEAQPAPGELGGEAVEEAHQHAGVAVGGGEGLELLPLAPRPAEHLHVGVAEGVDGLLGVAHDLHRHPRVAQRAEELALQGVDVLELVHEHHPVAPQQPLHRPPVAHHPDGPALDLRGREQVGAQPPLVGREHRLVHPHQPLVGLAGGGLEGARERALVEEEEQGLLELGGRQAVQGVLGVGGEVAQRAPLLLEQRLGLPVAHQAEVGVEAQQGRTQPQGLGHEAVDGGEGSPAELEPGLLEARAARGVGHEAEVVSLLQHVLDGPPHPYPQLVGGLAGEGDARDAAQGRARGDELEVAQHQAGGLASPGGGNTDLHAHFRPNLTRSGPGINSVIIPA